MVARSATARSDDVVVLNADSQGLGIAKPIRGRVASSAGVVATERLTFIKPQQPTELDKLGVDSSTEIFFDSSLKRALDVARESGGRKHGSQITIQVALVIAVVAIVILGRLNHRRCGWQAGRL